VFRRLNGPRHSVETESRGRVQLASCGAWSTKRPREGSQGLKRYIRGGQAPGPGGIHLVSGPDRRREVREGQFVGINSTALLVVSPSTGFGRQRVSARLGSRRHAPIRKRARQYPPPWRGDVHGSAKACHWRPRPAKTVSTTSSALGALQLPVNHLLVAPCRPMG
jgi:hypothetical protein